MKRRLSKAEQEKKETIILRLYDEGIPIVQIAAQFAVNPSSMHHTIDRLRERKNNDTNR